MMPVVSNDHQPKRCALGGKSSRRKGHQFERDIVNMLRTNGIDAARNLSQTRDAGGDIDLPGVLIECKRCESGFSARHLKQARKAAGDRIPVVAHRRSREAPRFVVEMNQEQFLSWLTLQID